MSLGKSSYFITCIDDYSQKCWVYFLKTKDEAFDTFKRFKALVENERGCKIKCLRTNVASKENSPLLTHLNKME
jgi:hypothetical protein